MNNLISNPKSKYYIVYAAAFVLALTGLCLFIIGLYKELSFQFQYMKPYWDIYEDTEREEYFAFAYLCRTLFDNLMNIPYLIIGIVLILAGLVLTFKAKRGLKKIAKLEKKKAKEAEKQE